MSATESFFKNYDDANVYAEVEDLLLSDQARNFVIEFGPDEAKIALNLGHTKFESLVKHGEPPRPASRPVRWINIWGPDTQPSIIDVIADCYGLSHRFREILKSSPRYKPKNEGSSTQAQGRPTTANGLPKNDIEQANGTAEGIPLRQFEDPGYIDHYAIAENLVNFQSIDVGEKFICVGANWMYHMGNTEKRLWSWLILCDDFTVISLHEDPRPENASTDYRDTVRSHTKTVLGQLSENHIENGGSMFLVSVRKILQSEASNHDPGSEGSNNLFYYLFDNWRGAYLMIKHNKIRLGKLSKEILGVLDEKHQKPANKNIIPELYKIGQQLRTNQHLYKSYESTIESILKYKSPQSGKRVVLALTASERFERLRERIRLLVLSSIDEAIAEKDALLNTYFQITAQKDSAATAKLSRNATLLSKLGVLFLPVSLMTSYFSTQIQDLQNVYTSKTYWVCFAVVMALSIIALFFLSRVLVTVTESLEARVNKMTAWCTSIWPKGKGNRQSKYGL